MHLEVLPLVEKLKNTQAKVRGSRSEAKIRSQI